MTIRAAEFPTERSLTQLSRLLFELHADNLPAAPATSTQEPMPPDLSRGELDDLIELAQSHHVVVRGLETYIALLSGKRDDARLQWAECALATEHERISKAIHFLHEVCLAFDQSGLDVLVIKSLDHWPDLGSDLDLYTNGAPSDVFHLMRERFSASIASRSLGDRMAHKWNFNIPGLQEPFEVHVGRLGQMGEQAVVATSLMGRSRTVASGGYTFRVPSVEHRLIISVLQRMYRHMYFRLCDILDTGGLADSNAIDYARLRSIAEGAGIWEGVATYLVIVSDYVRKYRGFGITLPAFVQSGARFGGHEIYYARGFLRVPIMPHSARLYGSQLAGTLRRGEVQAGARLSLLPWLATVALAKQKFTGSDKGIW